MTRPWFGRRGAAPGLGRPVAPFWRKPEPALYGGGCGELAKLRKPWNPTQCSEGLLVAGRKDIVEEELRDNALSKRSDIGGGAGAERERGVWEQRCFVSLFHARRSPPRCSPWSRRRLAAADTRDFEVTPSSSRGGPTHSSHSINESMRSGRR